MLARAFTADGFPEYCGRHDRRQYSWYRQMWCSSHVCSSRDSHVMVLSNTYIIECSISLKSMTIFSVSVVKEYSHHSLIRKLAKFLPVQETRSEFFCGVISLRAVASHSERWSRCECVCVLGQGTVMNISLIRASQSVVEGTIHRMKRAVSNVVTPCNEEEVLRFGENMTSIFRLEV
jgi:hypothetical protein